MELDDEMTNGNEEQREQLQEIINNIKLSEGFLSLARDLEIMEAKSPEDIYKVTINWKILILYFHEAFTIMKLRYSRFCLIALTYSQ